MALLNYIYVVTSVSPMLSSVYKLTDWHGRIQAGTTAEEERGSFDGSSRRRCWLTGVHLGRQPISEWTVLQSRRIVNSWCCITRQ